MGLFWLWGTTATVPQQTVRRRLAGESDRRLWLEFAGSVAFIAAIVAVDLLVF